MIFSVEEMHSKAGFSGTSSTLRGLLQCWFLCGCCPCQRTRAVQKVVKESHLFFVSRGKLNNSCFLADVRSHLQRKNSQADEAWRMSSPTEHCRVLQREEHQQPQQMHKNAWLRLLASLVCGHPQWRLVINYICAIYCDFLQGIGLTPVLREFSAAA